MITKTIRRNIRRFLFYLLFISPLRNFVFWVEDKISPYQGTLILMYHRVCHTNGELDDPYQLNTHPVNFERQMRYLAKSFPVVSLQQFVQQVESGKLPKKRQVVLTFDDGYEDNYQNVYPVLKKYRLPATIFLVTGYTNTRTKFWPWDRMEIEKTYDSSGKIKITKMEGTTDDGLLPCRESDLPLRWEQVREMNESGLISFGAHTCSHPILSQLNEENAKAEIIQSKQAIEANLNQRVVVFAYPYGQGTDFSEETKRILKAAGFKCACSALWGLNSEDCDLFALKRIMVSNCHLVEFAKIITRNSFVRNFWARLR